MQRPDLLLLALEPETAGKLSSGFLVESSGVLAKLAVQPTPPTPIDSNKGLVVSIRWSLGYLKGSFEGAGGLKSLGVSGLPSTSAGRFQMKVL